MQRRSENVCVALFPDVKWGSEIALLNVDVQLVQSHFVVVVATAEFSPFVDVSMRRIET